MSNYLAEKLPTVIGELFGIGISEYTLNGQEEQTIFGKFRDTNSKNMFSNDRQINVPIVSTYDKEPFERLNKVFERLIMQTGKHVSMPSEISLNSISICLHDLIESRIHVELYIKESTVKRTQTDGGDEFVTKKTYSFFEPVNSTSVFPNASIQELAELKPDSVGNVFYGNLASILVEKNDSVYSNRQIQGAEIEKNTKTRMGLMLYIGKTLKDDKSPNAMKLAKSLAEYMQQVDPDRYTTLDILKHGVYSSNARFAEGIKRENIDKLKRLIDKKSDYGRANFATVRFSFTLPDVDPGKIFRTKELLPNIYSPLNVENDWEVIFNPDDFTIHEFANILNPLIERGLLDDNDFQNLQKATHYSTVFDVVEKVLHKQNVTLKFAYTNLKNGATTEMSAISFLGTL